MALVKPVLVPPPPIDDFEHSDADAPDSPPRRSESRVISPARKSTWEALDVAGIFAPLEPVNYLIEPLDLCPGAPALVAGYGFSGKTVALQSAAVSIASGQLVWGTFKARRGRALHIDYEQGSRLTRARYQRLAAGMMVTPDELEGRLELVSLPQVYLDGPSAEGFLVEKVKGFDLVLVDSLRAAGPSIEENDSAVRGLLDRLNRVSEQTGACFVVIHHARKPSQNAGGGGAKMAIRGSGAIFDACSSVLILEAEKGKATRVTHEKARSSGICSDDFLLRIEDVEIDGDLRGGLAVIAERRAETQGSPSSSFRAVMERVLAELANGPAASKSVLAARVTGRMADKFAAIDQLVEDGRIIVTGKRHEAKS